MVLRDHIWNFSIKRVVLALSTDTPAWEYAYQHALPSDFIRALTTNQLAAAEWKIEGKFLISDDSAVTLRYVARITDTEQFDALFVEALASRLAAEFALPLADSVTLSEEMFSLYAAKLRTARGVDAQEGTPDGLDADLWLNARLGYVSPYNA
jgi:hypothetical protein